MHSSHYTSVCCCFGFSSFSITANVSYYRNNPININAILFLSFVDFYSRSIPTTLQYLYYVIYSQPQTENSEKNFPINAKCLLSRRFVIFRLSIAKLKWDAERLSLSNIYKSSSFAFHVAIMMFRSVERFMSERNVRLCVFVHTFFHKLRVLIQLRLLHKNLSSLNGEMES